MQRSVTGILNAVPKRGRSNFIIITQPRSGSYFFQSLLNSADDVVCHGEIFKKDNVELNGWHGKRLGIGPKDFALRDAYPYSFVMHLRNLNPYKNVGFKAFWPHLLTRKPLVERIVNNKKWKKIFLIRNPLETYASLLRAKQTKKWTQRNVEGHANVNDRVKVFFDPASFEEHLNEYVVFLDRNKQILLSQPNSSFVLNYKNATTIHGQDSVLDFIGSSTSASKLKSDYYKQYSGTLEEAFENWGDLMAFLKFKGCEGLESDNSNYDQLLLGG